MGAHQDHPPALNDTLDLGSRRGPLFLAALAIGLVGLVVAAAVGFADESGFGKRRFYYAYLIAFAFCASLAIGGLFFTLIQHVVRAGWSVVVRRVPEALASTLPFFTILSLPILYSVWQLDGGLYIWAQPFDRQAPHHEFRWEDVGGSSAAADPKPAASPSAPADAHAAAPAADAAHASAAHTDAAHTSHDAHAVSAASMAYPFMYDAARAIHPRTYGTPPLDEFAVAKRAWLNPTFFSARVIGYFAVLGLIGYVYWKRSVVQDTTKDPAASKALAILSAPLLLIFGLCVTFMVFDLLMSLDHTWYSTMMGVYYFAGSVMATFAFLALVYLLLQEMGLVKNSITTEHFHDLGKFLFAFMFFWSYVAYSQYMLLWYASIPETTTWLARRGATTAMTDMNTWSYISVALLFGHTLLPFLGLISRHVKRNKLGLAFWAIWLLGIHYLDMLWVVQPELDGNVYFGLIEIGTLLGVGGLFMAALVWRLGSAQLVPVGDPRLQDSLAFQNY